MKKCFFNYFCVSVISFTSFSYSTLLMKEPIYWSFQVLCLKSHDKTLRTLECRLEGMLYLAKVIEISRNCMRVCLQTIVTFHMYSQVSETPLWVWTNSESSLRILRESASSAQK